MKFPEVSLEQFQGLSPVQIQSYLEAQGWREQQHEAERHSVWTYRNEVGEAFVLLLPLNEELPDFADRMYDLARVLALVEQRYLPEVFGRLKQLSEGISLVDGLPEAASVLELSIWENVRELAGEEQRQVLAFVEFLRSKGDRFSAAREAG